MKNFYVNLQHEENLEYKLLKRVLRRITYPYNNFAFHTYLKSFLFSIVIHYGIKVFLILLNIFFQKVLKPVCVLWQREVLSSVVNICLKLIFAYEPEYNSHWRKRNNWAKLIVIHQGGEKSRGQ